MSASIRPSFSVDLACSSKVVLARLFERLGSGPYQLRRTRSFGGQNEGVIRAQDHFILTVADREQRVWSPWLNVEVKPQGDGAHLFARFSPHPSVWTLFAFSYLFLVTMLLLSLCFAGALVMSGATGVPWPLWVSGGALVVMALLWVASQVGQRWAQGQMAELRGALESAVEACEGAPARSGGAGLALQHQEA
ncbi:MAG: hypothetical protein MUF64_28600 [Polyangiaceae bacterium]|jgi:hypothetical protein|nr:hypothetical protein [Polyangiaceae bacterium]